MVSSGGSVEAVEHQVTTLPSGTSIRGATLGRPVVAHLASLRQSPYLTGGRSRLWERSYMGGSLPVIAHRLHSPSRTPPHFIATVRSFSAVPLRSTAVFLELTLSFLPLLCLPLHFAPSSPFLFALLLPSLIRPKQVRRTLMFGDNTTRAKARSTSNPSDIA